MIRLFGHYVSKLFLLLGGLEIALLYLCVLGGYALRANFGEFQPEITNTSLHSSAALYASLTSAAMLAMGLYQRGLQEAAALLVRLGISFFLATMAMSLVFYWFPGLFLGRGIFGLAMLLSIAALLTLRTVFFHFAGTESQKHRVLVLGSGMNAARIDHLVESEPERLGFNVVKYVRLEDGNNIIDDEKQIELTGSLLELVTKLEINEIVIAVDDRRKGLPVDDILDCKMSGIVIFDLLTFFEKETSRINIDLLHPSWIYYSPGFHVGVGGQNGKRALDITVSLLMILLFSPLFLLVALASLIESRGRDPVFYSQVRVGENGEHIRVHKFRSMHTNAESDGVARWASANDYTLSLHDALPI